MSAADWDLATAGLTAPLAIVDLDAFDRNTRSLVHRAGGKPIRLASKSMRCSDLMARALSEPGFSGIMGFCVTEAIWLVEEGFTDVFVAYPSVDLAALQQVRQQEQLAREITVTIDSVEHVELYLSLIHI